VLVGVQKINLPESTVVKSETSPPAWPAGGTHHGEHSGLRTAAAAPPGTGRFKGAFDGPVKPSDAGLVREVYRPE